MSDQVFMEAIVQTVLFFELSDEQTLSEDVAVAMMEQIASILQQLEPAEKKQFLDYIRRRATQTDTAQERQVIENMGSNLGLIRLLI